jgi:hypothetical protein
MEDNFNFKELYQVALKTTYPIEANGRTYDAGEIIAMFDKVQIADIQEIKQRAKARGGFENATHVTWESTEQIAFVFTQGVFSKTQFGLMNNSALSPIGGTVRIFQREILETNEDGLLEIANSPDGNLYIYKMETGEKITSFNRVDREINLALPFLSVVIDYHYLYENGGTVMMVGKKFTEGFLELEARTRVKDDRTGLERTGILRIPKLQLMSDLSIRLGKDPIVAQFAAVGYPVGERGNKKVMELFFLNNDIDSIT